MSDYTPVTDFSAKDALTSGDAEKIILGADFDVEFAAIQTAIATKYDSNDIASQAQAEAETSNSVLMSPLAVAYWADYNAGVVGDLQAVASLAAGGDKLFFFDDTDDTTKALTVGNGLEISTTTIQTPSSTAGAGLTYSSGVLAVGAGSGLTVNADDVAITDQAVSTTVPVGFTSGALVWDPSSLTAFGTTAGVDLDADYVVLSDAGTPKLALTSQIVTPEVPAASASTAYTLTEADFGKPIRLSSTSTVTVTLPNSLKTGFWCTLIKTGASGDVVLSAATTLNTKSSLTTFSTQYATVTVIHVGSNVWHAFGELES